LMPGTASLELALRAASEVGLDTIEELTLEAPLVLPEQGAIQLQVTLGAPDEDGRREIAVYARPEAGEGLADEREWVRHASGVVALAEADAPALAELAADSWPPAGAESLEIDSLYDRLAGHGFV